MKTAVTTMVITIAIPFMAMAQSGGQGGYITMPNLGNNSKPILLTPTTPGTAIQDFSLPGMKIEKISKDATMIWPTTPGTTIRDFEKPSYKIHRNAYGDTVIDSCTPGTTIRDFKEPSYKIMRGK